MKLFAKECHGMTGDCVYRREYYAKVVGMACIDGMRPVGALT